MTSTELAVSHSADRFWAAPAVPLSPARLVILLFLTAQAWDGVFTYVAVHAYGISAEGNALIQTWMYLVGPTTALVGAKLLASLCGVLLYVRGVHHALAGLTVLYMVTAIGPWLLIYARH